VGVGVCVAEGEGVSEGDSPTVSEGVGDCDGVSESVGVGEGVAEPERVTLVLPLALGVREGERKPPEVCGPANVSAKSVPKVASGRQSSASVKKPTGRVPTAANSSTCTSSTSAWPPEPCRPLSVPPVARMRRRCTSRPGGRRSGGCRRGGASGPSSASSSGWPCCCAAAAEGSRGRSGVSPGSSSRSACVSGLPR
jgi:hypothetical protein